MLSDQMKSLTEAIEASYETRRAALAALKAETHQTLRNFQQEREEMARALKTNLSNDNRERSEKTQEFLSCIANKHKEMAAAVRSKLSSYSNDRRQARAHWDKLTKAMRAKRAG